VVLANSFNEWEHRRTSPYGVALDPTRLNSITHIPSLLAAMSSFAGALPLVLSFRGDLSHITVQRVMSRLPIWPFINQVKGVRTRVFLIMAVTF